MYLPWKIIMAWEDLEISLSIFSREVFPNSSQQSFYTHPSPPHPFIFYLLTPPLPLDFSPPFSCYQPSFLPFNQTGVLAHSLPDSHALSEQHRTVGEGKKAKRHREKQAGDKHRQRRGSEKAGTEMPNLPYSRYKAIFTTICQYCCMIWEEYPPYGHKMDWLYYCLAQIWLWDNGKDILLSWVGVNGKTVF